MEYNRLEFRNKTNESTGENIKKFTDFHGNTRTLENKI